MNKKMYTFEIDATCPSDIGNKLDELKTFCTTSKLDAYKEFESFCKRFRLNDVSIESIKPIYNEEDAREYNDMYGNPEDYKEEHIIPWDNMSLFYKLNNSYLDVSDIDMEDVYAWQQIYSSLEKFNDVNPELPYVIVAYKNDDEIHLSITEEELQSALELKHAPKTKNYKPLLYGESFAYRATDSRGDTFLVITNDNIYPAFNKQLTAMGYDTGKIIKEYSGEDEKRKVLEEKSPEYIN